MKRLLWLAVRLYPAAWRRRYGPELQALLDEQQPRWRDIADVATGGLTMRVRYSDVATTAVAVALAASVIAGLITWQQQPVRFRATGAMTVHARDPDSLDTLPSAVKTTLNNHLLTAIAQRRGLYGGTPSAAFPEDLQQIKRRIRVLPVNPRLMQVSFDDADRQRTQQVVTDLMAELGKVQTAALELEIAQPAEVPMQPLSNRTPVMIAVVNGLLGGMLLGAAIGLVRRRMQTA